MTNQLFPFLLGPFETGGGGDVLVFGELAVKVGSNAIVTTVSSDLRAGVRQTGVNAIVSSNLRASVPAAGIVAVVSDGIVATVE